MFGNAAALVPLQEGGGSPVFAIIFLLIMLIPLAGSWKVRQKAGYPGWSAIIPIYNFYVWLKIGDNPGWYLILLIIPIANLYVIFKAYVDVAKSFGKGTGFGIAMVFFGFILIPLLGFGDAQYMGPPGQQGAQRGRPAGQGEF